MITNKIKVVECPRDGIQGFPTFIPTDQKIEYLQTLLSVGFDTLDFGSFVSPKAIPQMRDTAQVVEGLDLSNSNTSLLSIIANERGAKQALEFEEIEFLGFPFSVSETFQMRNTNSTILESLERVYNIQELCMQKNRTLVVYISMGFGNPYGDEWNVEIVEYWVSRLHRLGIKILALSDTIGVAIPSTIEYLFSNLIPEYSDVEFGAHLHTRLDNWEEKLVSALNSGCKRLDSVIRGYGGCPMAADKLVGNMPTEHMVDYLKSHYSKDVFTLDYDKFQTAQKQFDRIIDVELM